MPRYRYYGTLRGATGPALPSSTVYIYTDSGGTKLAAIYDSAGDALTNPTTTNARGVLDVYADADALWYKVSGDAQVMRLRRDQHDPCVYSPPALHVSAARALNAANYLSIPTYDGSNEPCHPTVVYYPGGWNGYRYWMAFTPLPGWESTYENPSIVASNDNETWVVPSGLTNPISPQQTYGLQPDPELCTGPDGRLYCFWLHSDWDGTSTSCRIVYSASADGVTWPAMSVARQETYTTRRPLSPAVLYEDGGWSVWCVNQTPSPNTIIRYRSSSLTDLGTPTTCTGTFYPLPDGKEAWHIDVCKVGGQYVMVIDTTTLDASGTGGSLVLAFSEDGLEWQVADRVFLAPAPGGWDRLLYRACILPTETPTGPGLACWYNGIGPGNVFRIGYSTASLDGHEYETAAHGIAAGLALNILAAKLAIPPYIVGDTFTRADGAIGTAESGQSWTNSAGTWLVSSNQAAAQNNENSIATVETGVSDGEAEVRIGALGTGSGYLVVRFHDAGNFLRIGYSSGVWQAQTVVAYNATSLGVMVVDHAPAVGDRIRVRYRGTAVTAYVNGVPALSCTCTDHTTRTKCGMQTQNNTTRFDDFWVMSLD